MGILFTIHMGFLLTITLGILLTISTPEEGKIGQNCIVPSHRSKGYGKLQIQKILEIFQTKATRIIKVTTDNHPFFVPAQKTYLSCGFREAGRSHTDAYGGLELIHYEYGE